MARKTCSACGGTGRHRQYPQYTCSRCDGTGSIDDGFGQPCDHEWVEDKHCATCTKCGKTITF